MRRVEKACAGTRAANSEGSRSEGLTRRYLSLHVGKPALLLHQEPPQVIFVTSYALHLAIKHHVEVDLVTLKCLADFVAREDLVRFRGGIVSVKTEHRSDIIVILMLVH